MMYSKKMVAVVKTGGRILREFDTNISGNESECSLLLPFNSEYSLLLKNLESRPARVKIQIDGEDVLSGNALIIQPGKPLELDGFMNSGGKVTNRFRFIQKTEQIINHRGDRIDDGIIRIEVQYEKPKPVTVDVYENHHHNHDHYWYHPRPYWPWNNPYNPWCPTVTYSGNLADNKPNLTNSISGSVPETMKGLQSSYIGDNNVLMASCGPLPEEGITVKGEILDQQYKNGYIGELETNSYVIIIRLKGTAGLDKAKVVTPVEVRTKIQCPTCGTMVKSGNKFCSNCGSCVIEI